MKTSSLRENIIAIIVAAILSFLIVFSIGNLWLLQSSVISPSRTPQRALKDIELVLKGWEINVVSNATLQGVKWISLTLLVNPEVKLSSWVSVFTTLKGAQISFSEEWDGIYTFYIDYKGGIKKWDVILLFPFSWQSKDINIGDVVVSDGIGQGRQLTF